MAPKVESGQGDSARSQVAEAFENRLANGEVEAESAGVEPGMLNPLVVEVIREIGFDISQNQTKSVAEKFREDA